MEIGSGVRNREAESIRSRSSGEYGRECKVETNHRDKTEQCERYICSRECLCCTEFFAELGASGEIETEVRCGQFYVFFIFSQYEASSTVLYGLRRRLWAEKEGRLERRLHTSVRHEPAHDRFCLPSKSC